MRKKIILLALLVYGCTRAQAQVEDDEYYRNQIDLLGGVRFDLHSQRKGISQLSADDKQTMAAFGFRFTHYFHNHWGAYADATFYGAGEEKSSDYRTLLAAPFEEHYFIDNYAQHQTTGNGIGTISLGAAYRIAKGRWSMQSRLGFGYKETITDRVSFNIKKKGSNDIYYVEYRGGDQSNSQTYKMIPQLVLGSNVSYQVYNALWLTADVGYHHPISRTAQQYKRVDEYSNQTVERRSFKSHDIGNYLDVSVGVSFFLSKW